LLVYPNAATWTWPRLESNPIRPKAGTRFSPPISSASSPATVDLRPRAVEDDADSEPPVDRELELRPVALAVVELEPADPVEHRRVLHGVRVAVLVRADVERLEVAVTGRAPDRPVEAALAVDGELDLDDAVEKLDVVDEADVFSSRRQRRPRCSVGVGAGSSRSIGRTRAGRAPRAFGRLRSPLVRR
jgi:hypothetical protein